MSARMYKCPYCNERYQRAKLVNHINKKHAELIPEDYTATRVVFNTINKRECGYCRVCHKETKWNETAGRYDVLCDDPKCKEELRRRYKENMLRVRGTYNILNDPEQQTKMLANRKISGKYKFTDGGVLTYTGSYEKKCLEFMDKVLEIPSKDILAPGPTLEYEMNGEKHFYITDFYLIPQNLIIEVKDGGDNLNTKDTPGMRSSRERTLAKEKLITESGEYNYVRLTNNNFAQLIDVLMEIKEAKLNEIDGTIIKVNESVEVINEAYVKNTEDIYYNKDKFESGEINLCFITGHSGSGKTTMGLDMQKDNIEHYQLDDLQCIADHFTMSNLKEYGDLIYSYFSGEGKKFYVTHKYLVNNNIPGSEYEDKLFPGFVHYAMKYANKHKDKKFILEGVWLFCNGEDGKSWFNPEEFKDYAFYIKGTSMIISKHRGALRDAKEDNNNKKDIIKAYFNNFFRKNWKYYFIDEQRITKFRNYFYNKVNENYLLENA